jgi:uncharacterized membrane protein YgdD (TMEM256/DUF423 family)
MKNHEFGSDGSTPASCACNFWTAIGATLGFLAVAIGAFGAHGLKDLLELHGKLAVYETGVLYHLVHAPVVFALGLRGTKAARTGALWITIGILVFSFSLYLLAILNARWLGAITPIGGVALMVGWAWLAVAGAKGRL